MSICKMFPELLSFISIFTSTTLIHITRNLHTALPDLYLPIIHTIHKVINSLLHKYRCECTTVCKRKSRHCYCIQDQLQPSLCLTFLPESTHMALLAVYSSSNPCTVLPLLMMFTYLRFSYLFIYENPTIPFKFNSNAISSTQPIKSPTSYGIHFDWIIFCCYRIV